MVEQLVEHRTQFVATPWPTTLRRKTFLVNIDDDDPGVPRIRHCQAQARVIDDVFEAIDEWDLVITAGMADKSEDHHQPERDAHQVLLQSASPVVLRAESALQVMPARCLLEIIPRPVQRARDFQGFRKNSIFTPASSMMS